MSKPQIEVTKDYFGPGYSIHLSDYKVAEFLASELKETFDCWEALFARNSLADLNSRGIEIEKRPKIEILERVVAEIDQAQLPIQAPSGGVWLWKTKGRADQICDDVQGWFFISLFTVLSLSGMICLWGVFLQFILSRVFI